MLPISPLALVSSPAQTQLRLHICLPAALATRITTHYAWARQRCCAAAFNGSICSPSAFATCTVLRVSRGTSSFKWGRRA